MREGQVINKAWEDAMKEDKPHCDMIQGWIEDQIYWRKRGLEPYKFEANVGTINSLTVRNQDIQDISLTSGSISLKTATEDQD